MTVNAQTTVDAKPAQLPKQPTSRSSKHYAGIGARKTPDDICLVMTGAAAALEGMGYTLRSGGAQGADTAFYRGISNYNLFQVFIPWEGFQGFTGRDSCTHVFKHMAPSLQSEAFNIAQEFHPAWHRLSEAAQMLMARNSFQVLGHDLETPADFVICWTPGGSGDGGTGQAIRIANHYGIPVIDLGGITIDQAEERIGELT
jgi:hypothetical protein